MLHDGVRLRGKGVPHLNGRGRGDQYVRLVVKIPERLTSQQRRILQELQSVIEE